MKTRFFLILTLCVISSRLSSHEQISIVKANSATPTISVQPVQHDPTTQGYTNHGFSTYHPLIVHFPIVLLIIAACVQLINLFIRNKILNYTILALTAIGLLTGYISSSFLHPHTTGLSENAQIILKEHEQWSYYTLYAAGIALILQVANVIVWKNKVAVNIVITLVLIGSAIFVSLAGHHGAQLTHIEGVGPMGNFIMKHDKH